MTGCATSIRPNSDEIRRLERELAEMTRRRDAWRAKAEGYDEVRRALREKVGSPWPPNLSRALWAGIAADEKKRADDAEARLHQLSDLGRAAAEILDFVARVGADPGSCTDAEFEAYELIRMSGNHHEGLAMLAGRSAPG